MASLFLPSGMPLVSDSSAFLLPGVGLPAASCYFFFLLHTVHHIRERDLGKTPQATGSEAITCGILTQIQRWVCPFKSLQISIMAPLNMYL